MSELLERENIKKGDKIAFECNSGKAVIGVLTGEAGDYLTIDVAGNSTIVHDTRVSKPWLLLRRLEKLLKEKWIVRDIGHGYESVIPMKELNEFIEKEKAKL